MMTTRKYGWIPDTPDHRDHRADFTLSPRAPAVLPPRVDLRPGCPPVYDQKALGSCTANAVAGALHYTAIERLPAQAGHKAPTPARLFIYYWTRFLEGNVTRDSGASLRGTMKSIATYGYPNDADWPYQIEKYRIKPGKLACDAGLKRMMKSPYYARVDQTVLAISTALAAGNPVAFGFSVYESFESQQVARSGIVPMPGPQERVLGGHAVTAVGYDDDQRAFIVRNSWGPRWGMAGYCMMPYAMLANRGMASDFWTVSWVADDAEV